MKTRLVLGAFAALCLASAIAQADTLELKNGSTIKGKYMGGTETEITFRVGSSVQHYDLADISSLKFESDSSAHAKDYSSNNYDSDGSLKSRPKDYAASDRDSTRTSNARSTDYVTIPSGTRISVRTTDAIDSTQNHVGDKFIASLEQPIMNGDEVVVPKGADVYGRLTESKASGTFAGKSQLRLELTGIVVNGRTIPMVTGAYEMTGKSKTASTAKRTVGGAAVGSLIGALAGGGKGAAIGAGVGGAAGAGSEVITKGDQVKVPSETLLDFTLEQDMSIPQLRG
jgi:hypothetical protein